MESEHRSGIVLLGLGPGEASSMTREAWQLLENISEIHLRTIQHPAVTGFPDNLAVHSYDYLYDSSQSYEEVYARIVGNVLELGRRPEGVVYAVPGHPFVAEATAPEIYRRAQVEGLPVRVVDGLSFLEPLFSVLGVDPFPSTSLVDALELASLHTPPFPPDTQAIIAQIHSRQIASDVKLTLMEVYPDDHPVKLVHSAGTKDCEVESLLLFEIDRSPKIGLLTALYVPPLGPSTSFEAFQEIIAHLRAPEGCPWDREQTHQTLRSHLLEETYEVLSALDKDDPQALSEELGDLLLQIVLHAQIGSEYGEFRMPDILRQIHAKILRRHPHVFGDLELKEVSGVLENWERLKADERKANGEPEKGLLDGVPLALPALAQAQEYQNRAARVGFDWPKVEGVYDKLIEELEEVRSAEESHRASEIGDLLFSAVNLARWYKVDGESALREANYRFHRRFSYVEKSARMAGRSLTNLTLDEMEKYWEKAKGERDQ